SASRYSGGELGRREGGDVPAGARQDARSFPGRGVVGGRDGCRVPLPWTREGSSFGFGSNGAHLPQPSWFAESSVEAEDDVATSTLTLYRQALALRRELQADEGLVWDEQLSQGDVLAFRRPNGW